MSLSAKSARSFALLLFASAFLITACNDPKEIGLPQGQSLGVFFKDNFNIRASTVLADSVITSGSTYLLAGKASDLQTGTVTATSYFQPDYLNPAEPPTFEAGATVDSLVIELPYDYVYGDSTVEQRLTVHLLERPIAQRIQYSFDELPYSAQVVGSVVFKPTPRAARRVVKIHLLPSVASMLVSLSGKSLQEYQAAFNGFALVADGDPNGAVITYRASNLQQLNSNIRIYYKEGVTEKNYAYPISSGTPVQPYLFNRIAGNRAGTVLESIRTRSDVLQASAQNGEAVYVQGGTGLMAKLEITNLGELMQAGNVAINRAELIVPQLAVNKLPAANQLILYNSDAQGNLLRDPERTYPVMVSGTDFVNLFPLVTVQNNSYVFNITATIGQLLREKRTNKTLYLSLPSLFVDDQIRILINDPRAQPRIAPPLSLEESIGGIVLGGPRHPSLPMKLRIYYTPINAN
jgi:hypothetical protein